MVTYSRIMNHLLIISTYNNYCRATYERQKQNAFKVTGKCGFFFTASLQGELSLPLWCVWQTHHVFSQDLQNQVILAEKQKQNCPIPQWTQMKACNKIRYNSKKRHWGRTKLGLQGITHEMASVFMLRHGPNISPGHGENITTISEQSGMFYSGNHFSLCFDASALVGEFRNKYVRPLVWEEKKEEKKQTQRDGQSQLY